QACDVLPPKAFEWPKDPPPPQLWPPQLPPCDQAMAITEKIATIERLRKQTKIFFMIFTSLIALGWLAFGRSLVTLCGLGIGMGKGDGFGIPRILRGENILRYG